MQNSTIEWTDKTWNPVTGCTKVSQGCKNCYAEKIYERFNGKGSFRNVTCHSDRLTQPLKWKKPARIFVNSMSDLFHEDVPFAFIDLVFAVMKQCQQHTFQILTKRPERMNEWYNYRPNFFSKLDNAVLEMMDKYDGFHSQLCYIQNDRIEGWPLPNVWIGVSAENQETANERLPYLNMIPATVKFVSAEPLLGPIDFEKALGDSLKWHAGGLKNCISWVITGGESGPGARPVHPDWIISIRDQCAADYVPFFFKQWGNYLPHCQLEGYLPNLVKASAEVKFPSPHNPSKMNTYYRIGKTKAGNLLNGKQYLEFPAVKQ